MTDPTKALADALAEAVKSEPTELISKWRVMELINEHRATQQAQASATYLSPALRALADENPAETAAARNEIEQEVRAHQAGEDGAEMPETTCWGYDKAKKTKEPVLYTADHLTTYRAAGVRQALEEAARVAGPEDSYQDEWFKAKADSVNRIRALIPKA
jgi:hypothetical protein